MQRVNQASAAAVHFVLVDDAAHLSRGFTGSLAQTAVGTVQNDQDLLQWWRAENSE